MMRTSARSDAKACSCWWCRGGGAWWRGRRRRSKRYLSSRDLSTAALPGAVRVPARRTRRVHVGRRGNIRRMPGHPILTDAELASIRREYRAASLLPARCYQDQSILDWEREHILARDWVLVAREEDVPDAGSFRLLDVDGENVIIIRGRDDVIRAFYNVCRHRGTA